MQSIRMCQQKIRVIWFHHACPISDAISKSIQNPVVKNYQKMATWKKLTFDESNFFQHHIVLPTHVQNVCNESAKYQGPIVQSVVSLTSSLRVILLNVLADSMYNILIFFAEKLHCKSYSHFFSKKFQHICVSLNVNFNELLTNDAVSIEQLGPDCFNKYLHALLSCQSNFSRRTKGIDSKGVKP